MSDWKVADEKNVREVVRMLMDRDYDAHQIANQLGLTPKRCQSIIEDLKREKRAA